MKTCLRWTNRAKTTCFICGKQTLARSCLKDRPYIPWMVGQCPAGGQRLQTLFWVEVTCGSVLHKIFILSRDVNKAHQLYLYSTKSCKKVFNHLLRTEIYLDSYVLYWGRRRTGPLVTNDIFWGLYLPLVSCTIFCKCTRSSTFGTVCNRAPNPNPKRTAPQVPETAH